MPPATFEPLVPVKVVTLVLPCCTVTAALQFVINGAALDNEPVEVNVVLVPPASITLNVYVYDSLTEAFTP